MFHPSFEQRAQPLNEQGYEEQGMSAMCASRPRLGKIQRRLHHPRLPNHPPAPRRPAGLPSATPQDRRRRLRPDAGCAGLVDVGALGGDGADGVLGGEHGCHFAAILTPPCADSGRSLRRAGSQGSDPVWTFTAKKTTGHGPNERHAEPGSGRGLADRCRSHHLQFRRFRARTRMHFAHRNRSPAVRL
jgi:hypothetical protein